MNTTTDRRPRRMATLDMRGASGVARGANRTQMSPDGEPVDGWMVMKADGTLVDDPVAAVVERAEKAERDLVTANEMIGALRTAAKGNVVAAAALEHVTKDDAFGMIEAVAEEIMKSDLSLTRERAIDLASQRRPDLVKAYREAPYVAPERVERADTRPPGSEYIDAMNRLATKYSERTGAGPDKALGIVMKSAEGVRLSILYYQASGLR